MKNITSLFTAIVILFISSIVFTKGDPKKGEQLAIEIDRQPRFQKLKGETVLNIYESDGKLKFKKVLIVGQYLENMGKENQIEKSISYMISPADERGNAFLSIKHKNKSDEKTAYIRGIRKAKKIAGAEKKTPFFGSDFYIHDMGYPEISEYNYFYHGKEKVEFKGKMFECLVVEAIPKTPQIKSETGYGRKVAYIVKVNKVSYIALKVDYYDENMKLLKVMRLKSFLTSKNIKGETVFFPTSLELKNVQRGTKTVLEIQNMKFGKEADLRTDIFSEQYLTKRWW